MDVGGHPLLTFDEAGRLVLDYGLMNQRYQQASCCVCDEPVRWVLDMFSFRHNDRGTYDLGHAWCLWTPEAFDNAKKLAAHAARGEQ